MSVAQSQPAKSLLHLVRRWGPRTGFSIADQGIVSGANFLLNMLLAVWLSAAEYGTFATVFTVFLLLSGFHNALVLEPLSVLGPLYSRDDIPKYTSKLASAQTGLTMGLGVLVAVPGLVITDESLRPALLAMALAMPLILLFWLFRRAFYLHTESRLAALSSSIYAIALLVALVGLWRWGLLSAATAFLSLGVASLLASLVAHACLNSVTSQARGGRSEPTLISVLDSHWRYGKLIVLATTLTITATQIQTIAAAGLLGFEQAGALRAMQVFALPMSQVLTAIVVLGTPILSSEFQKGRLSELRGRARLITISLTGAAFAYEICLVPMAVRIETFLYGGKYADSAWLIPVLGLVPLFTALTVGYSIALRAIQRPEYFLLVGMVTLPVALLSSTLLTIRWGLAGAVTSLVLTYASSAVVTYHLYRTWIPPTSMPRSP